MRVKSARVYCLVSRVVLRLQRVDVSVVDVWPHGIADRVVAGDTGTSIKVSYEIVLSEEAQIRKVLLPIRHILPTSALEDDYFGRTIDVLTQLFIDMALSCFDLNRRLILGNGKIVDDNTSK